MSFRSFSLASLLLGGISVILFQVSIIPLAGIACGVIALSIHKREDGSRWMAITGLLLSVVYMVIYVNAFSRDSPSSEELIPPRDRNLPVRLSRPR